MLALSSWVVSRNASETWWLSSTALHTKQLSSKIHYSVFYGPHYASCPSVLPSVPTQSWLENKQA